MPRLLIRSAAFLATVVVLAGCFSIESKFEISDDGTADIEFVLLVDTEQLSELAGLFGQDAGLIEQLSPSELLAELTEGEDPCADLTGSLIDYDVTVSEIEDGSAVGVGCTVEDVPLDDLNDIGADSALVITQNDDGTRFELTLAGVDELTDTGAGDVTDLLDIDVDDLLEIRFVASAPGSLGENNATSTSGSTATWVVTGDAAFVTGGTATMTAQWAAGGSGSSNVLWIILGIVAVVAAVAVIAYVLTHRSKPSDDGPSGSADAGAPTPFTPPPPATLGGPPTAPPPPTPPSAAPPPPPPATSPPPPPPPSSPPPPPPS